MSFYSVAVSKSGGALGSEGAIYSSSQKFVAGNIVSVPLQGRQLPGIVIEQTSKPVFATKPISELIYTQPLPRHLMCSIQWLQSYYANNLGEIARSILPTGVTKKRRKINIPEPMATKTQQILPTKQQTDTIKQFTDSDAKTMLLHGATGSGKTYVYQTLINATLQAGNSVLLLTPEIQLSIDLYLHIKNEIEYEIDFIHSKLSESIRHQIWEGQLVSDKPRLVLGTRSALFSPLKNVGLIILDESHDQSYQQSTGTKYDARRLASKIASTSDARILLASATPDITDYYLASKSGRILRMPVPINATKPTINVVDMRDKQNRTQSGLARTSINAIQKNIDAQKKTILMLNKRGTASSVVCNNCGWHDACSICELPITFHRDSYLMLCHVCGTKQKPKTNCPKCTKPELQFKGMGTKQLEQNVRKLFPNAVIFRYDQDSVSKQDGEEIHTGLHNNENDIIIGTQMIAKGLNIPDVGCVVVVNTDTLLTLPDFTASERTFQLIHQVSGRSGRMGGDRETILQTYNPTSSTITALSNDNWLDFYNEETIQRKNHQYPPFAFLLRITTTAKKRETVLKRLTDFAVNQKNCTYLGPSPMVREKGFNGYTWQLLFKSNDRKKLVSIAHAAQKQKLKIELDPISLL